MKIVSNLGDNSLKCELCGSKETLHVRHLEDNVTTEAYWRCMGCKKEYGAENIFYKLPDSDKIHLKVKVLWKRDTKDESEQV